MSKKKKKKPLSYTAKKGTLYITTHSFSSSFVDWKPISANVLYFTPP